MIDPLNELCNDIIVICITFQQNVINVEIIVGKFAEKRVFLPRIHLCQSNDEMFLFKPKRKQFPIQLSFSMTTNKSNGQTIPNVRVYMTESILIKSEF